MTRSADQPIVLFDLFGVLALHQRPGALEGMAALCDAPLNAFAEAYWEFRPSYDAARQSSPEYWTAVLGRLSRPVDPNTLEKLRLADIDGWSRVDERMVGYALSLRGRAKVAVLSNIPADHADAFQAAQPWLRSLDYVAFSGEIKAAKPDPAAFRHCVTAMHAAPADFLFVDDREENITAARAIGMTGHVFTGLDNLAKVVNVWLTDAELPARLRALLGSGPLGGGPPVKHGRERGDRNSRVALGEP